MRKDGQDGSARLEDRQWKYRIWDRVFSAVAGVFWIIASWVPLQPVQAMVHDLAGKETHVTAVINITVAISFAFAVGWTLTAMKSRNRKKTINRLRARQEELEHKLQMREPHVTSPVADSAEEKSE